MQVLRAASPVDTPSLSPAPLPEGEGRKPGAHQSLSVCSPRPLAGEGPGERAGGEGRRFQPRWHKTCPSTPSLDKAST